MRRANAYLKFSAVIFFTLLGCDQLATKSSNKNAESLPARFNSLNTSNVKHLLIKTPDWLVASERTLSPSFAALWKVRGLSLGSTPQLLTDDRADSAWYEHFLETLKSLPFKKKLESQVEFLPYYSIEVQFSRESLPTFRFEFSEHFPTQNDDSRLVRLTPSSNMPASQESESLWLVDGAALEMLARIQEPHFLRQRRLTVLKADEVDEVEISIKNSKDKSRKTSTFYMQKKGEGWADRNNKKLHSKKAKAITPWLEELTHLRILHFNDDIKIKDSLNKELTQVKITLRNFQGREEVLELKKTKSVQGSLVYLYSSLRPDAVFEGYPQSEMIFQKISQ